MNKYNYKSFVGPEQIYDTHGQSVFDFLIGDGLKPNHNVLDIGCGSLRVGKYLIPFLDTGKYYGLEPEKQALADGIKYEVGKDVMDIKHPKFLYNSNFDFSGFTASFDFIIASSIFIHCGVEQFKKCLCNLINYLNNHTRLYITIKLSDKTREYPWVGRKRYTYSSHSETEYNLKHFNAILNKYGVVATRVPISHLSEAGTDSIDSYEGICYTSQKLFLITKIC